MDQVKILKFLGTWVMLSITLLITTQIFPGKIVLGNASLSSAMAGVFNSFVLILLLNIIPSLTEKLDLKIKDPRFNWTFYFFGNLIVIWVLKRLATITGLGVENIFLIILIAIIITAIEILVEKYSNLLFKAKK